MGTGNPHVIRRFIISRLRYVGLKSMAMALLCLSMAGCGSSKPIMEGTVALDGVPIEKGTIMLMPIDGKGQTAGCGIEAGKYRMQASPGIRQVLIGANRKDGKMPDPMSPGSGALIDRYVNYVPERYNEKSELTVTIKPGLNNHNFALEGSTLRPDGKK
jgi:hypothetical protein